MQNIAFCTQTIQIKNKKKTEETRTRPKTKGKNSNQEKYNPLLFTLRQENETRKRIK
jgi:hypothetical protein